MAKIHPQPVSPDQLSGRLGDLVFVRRGARPYVRRHVTPEDPKTPAQVTRRRRFRDAVAAWQALPERLKDLYRQRARAAGRKGYHLFLAEYLGEPSQSR